MLFLWTTAALCGARPWLLKYKVPGGYVAISRHAGAFAVNLFKDRDPYIWKTPNEPRGEDNAMVITEHDSVVADGTSVTWLPEENRLVVKKDDVVVKSAPIDLSGDKPVAIRFLTNPHTRLYGRGAGMDDASIVEFNVGKVAASVGNMFTYVPYYYAHGDGYLALADIEKPTGPVTPGEAASYGVSYERTNKEIILQADTADSLRVFIVAGMKTVREATLRYNLLMGLPPVPPRFAFGFLACRWGWKDRDYIDDILSQFRKGKYPVDALIIDFEWFTKENDYNFNLTGKSTYTDFGFNPVTFPKPKKQLKQYHNMHIKFGGIRKPRLGNSALLKEARSLGILMDKRRGLNFTSDQAKQWYGRHMRHFLDDGVDFWWNDEGETDYLTFFQWNVAEMNIVKENHKFFSINRAFIPGQQSLGAMTWTGDIVASWDELRKTPGYVVNWGLAGNAYTMCDIGGFRGEPSALLLLRWFQLGVFMPIMRVHSSIAMKPHFPFLWETKEELRQALIWRERMVPYHYTLAHRLSRTGELIAWPMAALYEEAQGMDLTTQFMDGPNVLVAPVLSEDNKIEVFFPSGTWYNLNSTDVIRAPKDGKTVNYTLALNEFAAFVPAGTIMPIGPDVQYAEQKADCNMPLQIRVYEHDDKTLNTVTFHLEEGEGRETYFEYDPAKLLISWKGTGSAYYPSVCFQRFAPGGAVPPCISQKFTMRGEHAFEKAQETYVFA